MNEKPKRKTKTSTQVKARYNKKMYTRVYADLPNELFADFKISTNENGVSMASIVRAAIKNYLIENPPQMQKATDVQNTQEKS